MNILSVHNKYLYRGGEDESSELETALLRKNGHAVVEYVADNHNIGGTSLVKLGLRSIWNPSSYSTVRKLIREHNVDLVRIDNFFPQISPAVYYAAAAEGVPSIQALRNFRLLCPGAVFFRDGAVCEDCAGKLIAWPGIVHGCYRKSSAQTLAPVAMASVHRIVGTWHSRVSAYVALSEFSRDKFIANGLPTDKIFVKPNFVIDHGIGKGEDGCAIYVGRLSPEKGIDTLLAAWHQIGSRLKLRILGTGPLEDMVRDFAAEHPNVEYLGAKPLAETYELMGRARALIFTSKWYETFGRTVAESYAKGTPVIAAKLGTMQTMVKHGVSGLHYDASRAESLVEQVDWMLAHPDEWQNMRASARQLYEQLYTPERNYQMMMEIYQKTIAMKRGQSEGVARLHA